MSDLLIYTELAKWYVELPTETAQLGERVLHRRGIIGASIPDRPIPRFEVVCPIADMDDRHRRIGIVHRDILSRHNFYDLSAIPDAVELRLVSSGEEAGDRSCGVGMRAIPGRDGARRRPDVEKRGVAKISRLRGIRRIFRRHCPGIGDGRERLCPRA